MYESEVQEETIARQTISAMASDLRSTRLVVTLDAVQYLMVGKAVLLFECSALGFPSSDCEIIILESDSSMPPRPSAPISTYLSVAKPNRVVDIVAYCLKFSLQCSFLL